MQNLCVTYLIRLDQPLDRSFFKERVRIWLRVIFRCGCIEMFVKLCLLKFFVEGSSSSFCIVRKHRDEVVFLASFPVFLLLVIGISRGWALPLGSRVGV